VLCAYTVEATVILISLYMCLEKERLLMLPLERTVRSTCVAIEVGLSCKVCGVRRVWLD